MTLPIDNLTEQEMQHFARLAQSSLEQQTLFRKALNSLLRCFGNGADASALVVYLDHNDQMVYVSQFGMSLPLALQLTEAAHATIVDAITAGAIQPPTETLQ